MRRTWIAGIAVGCAALAACSSGASGGASSASKTSGTGTGTGTGPASAAAAGSTWTIGQIGSFTGPAAAAFIEDKAVLSAWADSTNANGGINGHRINLIQIDDATDPAKSIAAVHRLVQSDNVIAVVDNSLIDSVWATYAEQQKIPILGGATYNPPFGTNPYFFPSGATFNAVNYGLLTVAKQAGSPNVAITCIESPACSENQTFTKSEAPQAGVKIGYTSGFVGGAPNFTAQCLGAKSAGVNALYVGSTAQDIFKFYSDCEAQGYSPTKILTFFSSQNTFLSKPQAQGLLMTSDNAPLVPGSPATAFLNAMAKYQPGTTVFGGQGEATWAAGLLFAAAAKAGGLGDNPTRAQLVSGLYALKGDTLGGMSAPLTFTQGQGHKVECYFVVGIKDGKYTAPHGLSPECAPNGT